MKLEAEILQAIEANLPEQVGTVLKKRLEDAEDDKQALDRLSDEFEKTCKNLRALQHLEGQESQLNDKDSEYVERIIGLELREAALAAKEECLEKSNNQIFRLASIAFDNPKLKYEFGAGVDVPYQGKYGQENASQSVSLTGGETTERDK